MYFSGKDAAIYINQNFIHDAVTFEFSETQQKLPVYGYKSVLWDDVLLGDIMIQGGFMINMKQPADLATRNEKIDVITRFEGSNDVAFTPPIWGEAPIARNKVDIQLIYSTKDFKDTMDRLGQVLTTGNSNQYNWVQDKLYGTSQELRIITIEDAVITSHSQSTQIDSTPIGDFYSFIARRIK